MERGIANLDGSFIKIEFKSYDNIPESVIMPYPRHNANHQLIQPVKYILNSNIEFVWTETWGFDQPPFLIINSKLNGIYHEYKTIERVSNATTDNVILKLKEYSNIENPVLLSKRVSYLEECIKQYKLKSNKNILATENKLEQVQVEMKTLQKCYDDLLTILKSK